MEGLTVSVATLKARRRALISEHVKALNFIDQKIAIQSRFERVNLPCGKGRYVYNLCNSFLTVKPVATFSEVAHELNRRGIKGPMGKRWNKNKVARWMALYEAEFKG